MFVLLKVEVYGDRVKERTAVCEELDNCKVRGKPFVLKEGVDDRQGCSMRKVTANNP